MLKKLIIATMSICLLVSCDSKKVNTQEEKAPEPNYDMLLLVGTYTAKDSKGINILKFDTETGASKFVSEAEVSNPSYLVVSKNENYVYAISENGEEDSKVTAFKLDKTKGELELLNSHKSGNGPCFITIDETGKHIITADYGGGTITILGVNEDGSLADPSRILSFKGKSIHPERQTKSYLHNVRFSPDEKFLFANDLGADKIYRFEVKKEEGIRLLKQTKPAEFMVRAGSGPRHTEFHPNGKFAYTITEISGEVIAFDYDAAKGLLKEIQTVKADKLNAQGSGDIQIAPNGKFLYASNRLKGDGIAIFSIDTETGQLTKIGYQETGVHPRNLVITPDGKLLLSANRDSDNIQVFKIGDDGLLTKLDKDIKLSMPVCLKFASLK